jgi:chemotaxis protein methyltransferase CheR
MKNEIVEDNEIKSLLIEIKNRYGYDFLDYSLDSFKRRIIRLITFDNLANFAELRFKVLNDEDYFNTFIEKVTVTVTEMFREPLFFKALKEKILPQLATYPFIRIWHAGCATGEEIYSMAIMLKEEGLLEKSLIYATDINQQVLEQAQSGLISKSQLELFTQNYKNAGGKEELSDYYHEMEDGLMFDKELKRRMVFSTHNLVSDQSFNEFNLVVCRNVLIYFKRELQNRVIGLFKDSLPNLGFLALGNKESIMFTDYEDNFKYIDNNLRIWQKIN